MLSPEWKDRVDHWIYKLSEEFYEPKGILNFEGYTNLRDAYGTGSRNRAVHDYAGGNKVGPNVGIWLVQNGYGGG